MFDYTQIYAEGRYVEKLRAAQGVIETSRRAPGMDLSADVNGENYGSNCLIATYQVLRPLRTGAWFVLT